MNSTAAVHSDSVSKKVQAKKAAPSRKIIGKTTVFELASQLYEIPRGRKGVSVIATRKVTDGMEPATSIPDTPNVLHQYTPEQVAALRVNLLWVTEDGIDGFQRDLDGTNARRMAAAMVQAKFFPPILCGLDNEGVVWVIDGDHRAVASIIARKLLPVVIYGPMTQDEMAIIFNDQNRAKRINREHHIMLGQTPAEHYIAAVQYEKDHPWRDLACYRGSTTKMGLVTAHEMALTYSTGRTNRGRRSTAETLLVRDWDDEWGDELAGLLKPILGKKTDPFKSVAWKAPALRGLAVAATKIIRKRGSHVADIRRWERHMVAFPWHKYAALSRSIEFEYALISFWNKSLRGENRVELPMLKTAVVE